MTKNYDTFNSPVQQVKYKSKLYSSSGVWSIERMSAYCFLSVILIKIMICYLMKMFTILRYFWQNGQS